MKALFYSILFIFFGCAPIIKTVNGLNKQKQFESLNDYEKYISKKFDINLDHIAYLSKEDFHKINPQKENVFFLKGIYNTSGCSFLSNDTSCSGVLEKQLQSSNWEDCKTKLKHNPLDRYKLYDRSGNKIAYSENNKYALVYFNHNMGSFHKSRLKILYKNTPNSVTPLIISLDKYIEVDSHDR